MLFNYNFGLNLAASCDSSLYTGLFLLEHLYFFILYIEHLSSVENISLSSLKCLQDSFFSIPLDIVISDQYKAAKTDHEFKMKIKSWEGFECTCRICI